MGDIRERIGKEDLFIEEFLPVFAQADRHFVYLAAEEREITLRGAFRKCLVAAVENGVYLGGEAVQFPVMQML